MTVFTQGFQTSEYLVSEAAGARSRDVVTVTVTGAVALPSGTVLGKITSTGKFIKQVDAAVDGSQAAAAILYNPLPGVNGDTKCTVHNTDCEVIGAVLNGGAGPSATARTALLALGIKVR